MGHDGKGGITVLKSKKKIEERLSFKNKKRKIPIGQKKEKKKKWKEGKKKGTERKKTNPSQRWGLFFLSDIPCMPTCQHIMLLYYIIML